MKTNHLLLILGAAALLAGCAKKDDSSSSDTTIVAAPAVISPTGTGTISPSTISTNGTVPFTVAGANAQEQKNTMENYKQGRPLNNGSGYRISMNLTNAGENRYAGEVRIMYEDTDGAHTGIFTARTGTNQSFPSLGQNTHVGEYQAQYNYWFNLNGRTVFSGFFEDVYGAIVIVIDGATNLGDGQGSSNVSGSIWFKNADYSFYSGLNSYYGYRHCWFLGMGPNQCQSNIVINKTSLEPTDTYRKLGTFTGLVTSQAFH